MIASVSGIVDKRNDPYLIIDVNGIGYKICAASSVLASAELGKTLKLYTYMHIREDNHELYGFSEYADLKIFEYLIGVSGVGPKTAIGIFSIGSRNEIINAIVRGDTSFFTSVPRLGKKNAQKLIIELKSKLGSNEEFDVNKDDSPESDDVIFALKGFGFSANEAYAALRAINKDGLSTGEKVRLALKYLGK